MIQGYLFECPENAVIHKRLSARPWINGSTVILPPLRITGTRQKMRHQYFIVQLYRPPVNYKNSGYIPQRKYQIKQIDYQTWRLRIVK